MNRSVWADRGVAISLLSLPGVERAVELHELDAGGVKHFLPRDCGESVVHHSVGSRIAIHNGVAEHFAGGGEEAEIYAPGVDADAAEGGV